MSISSFNVINRCQTATSYNQKIVHLVIHLCIC